MKLNRTTHRTAPVTGRGVVVRRISTLSSVPATLPVSVTFAKQEARAGSGTS